MKDKESRQSGTRDPFGPDPVDDADAARERSVLARLETYRDRYREDPRKNFIYRCVVGVIGGAITIGGIITIPFPGPGWALVFLGLAILATEFTWAQRVLEFAREKYDQFFAFLGRRSRPTQMAIWAAIIVVTVATLWLVNAGGMFAGVIGWDADWVRSPLPFF